MPPVAATDPALSVACRPNRADTPGREPLAPAAAAGKNGIQDGVI